MDTALAPFDFDRVRGVDRTSTPASGWLPSNAHAVPLARHITLTTQDVRQAVQAGTRLMRSQSIRTRSERDFAWTLHTVGIGDSVLGYHSYGSTVEIIGTEPADYFTLEVLLRGRFEASTKAGPIELSTPGEACVMSPTQRLRMRYEAGTEQLFVKLPAKTVERALSQLSGGYVGGIEFDPRTPSTSAWLANLRLAVQTIDSTGLGSPPVPQLGRELERMLVSALLLAQPHSGKGLITRPAVALASSAVASIAEQIRSVPADPVDFAQLAHAHAISVRTLQKGFLLRFGRSPSSFLRDCRLDRAHEILTQQPDLTVTEVAYASGFNHLGRFARDYRLRYGAAPSATLRAARGVSAQSA